MKQFISRNLLKTVLLTFIVFAVMASMVTQTLATQYTKTHTAVSAPGGYNYLQWTHTLAIWAVDTVFVPLKVGFTTDPHDTILTVVNIATLRAAADSKLVITVGYQYSGDGTNWSSITTLGTDSTTWEPGSAVTWKINTYRLGAPSYNGQQAYQRLRIAGKANNTASGKIKIQSVEQ